MSTKMCISVEILTFTLEEKSHEFNIWSGEDLCLVCSGSHSSAGLAGGHLDGDPRQQLVKQITHPCWPNSFIHWIGVAFALPGASQALPGPPLPIKFMALCHSEQGIGIPWCITWREPKKRTTGPPRPASPGGFLAGANYPGNPQSSGTVNH
jgi:hypothetical protein